MAILTEKRGKGHGAFVTDVKHINNGYRAKLLSDNRNETRLSRSPAISLFSVSLWWFYFHNVGKDITLKEEEKSQVDSPFAAQS